MANTFEGRKDVYTDLWDNVEIKPERRALVDRQVERINAGKSRYQAIEAVTNVPWYVIGLIHLRESNLNFDRHLHNGDPLTGKTYRVPAGRIPGKSPPYTFEESAEDALRYDKLTDITDWSIERIAYVFEKFNGFGYVKRGVNSPYLWASTNHYTRGKFVRDGVYSSTHVDTQLGVMAVLKALFEKEPVIEPKVSHTEIAVAAPKAPEEKISTKELVKVSRKAWYTDLQNKVLAFLGLGGVAGKAATFADVKDTAGVIDGIKSVFMTYGVELILLIIIFLLAVNLYKLKLQKEDIAEGRNEPSGA